MLEVRRSPALLNYNIIRVVFFIDPDIQEGLQVLMEFFTQMN